VDFIFLIRERSVHARIAHAKDAKVGKGGEKEAILPRIRGTRSRADDEF